MNRARPFWIKEGRDDSTKRHKMKFKFILGLILIPTFCFATVQSLKTGDLIGDKSTGKLGFYGTAPVARPANTKTAQEVLETVGLKATGGLDQSVHHVQVSLAAADILGLYATPIQLVAAPASGKSIIVVKAVLTITRTSTAFASGGVGIIQYDSTTHGGGTQACDSTIASTVFTGAAGTTVTVRNGAVISDLASTSIQAKGLYISNQTGSFTTGTGTATVDVDYLIN